MTDLRQRLVNLTRKELVIAARKLRIKGLGKKSKDYLIDAIETCRPSDIKQALQITWWDRHKFEVFGWASVVGCILAVIPFLLKAPNQVRAPDRMDESRLTTLTRDLGSENATIRIGAALELRRYTPTVTGDTREHLTRLLVGRLRIETHQGAREALIDAISAAKKDAIVPLVAVNRELQKMIDSLRERSRISPKGPDGAEIEGLTEALLANKQALAKTLKTTKDVLEVDLSSVDLSGAFLMRLVEPGDKSRIAPSLQLDHPYYEGSWRWRADLQGINFYRANLEGGRFAGVNFSQALLNETKGMAADFEAAVLNGTDFEGAELTRANFKSCTCANANFRRSNLFATSFERAFVQGAHFEGARGIKGWQFEGSNWPAAHFDGEVRLLLSGTQNR